MALLRRLIGLIGPGGVGVFQWPYRTDDSGLVAASRWLRERLPGANAVANRASRQARRRSVHSDAHLRAGRDARGVRPRGVPIDARRAGASPALDYAIVFAQKREAVRESSVAIQVGTRAHGSSVRGASPDPDGVSDAEIDAFNRAADVYFTSLADWEHHLAKPFSQIEETPTLLMDVAVLLQALRLTPGMTVLEFGAGSGWLSRFLTQMGCRVVLLDVSPDRAADRARALRAAAGDRRAAGAAVPRVRRPADRSARRERRPDRLLRRVPPRAQSATR